MKLVIGDKNYSSWSMRPWLVLKHFGIAFEEVMVLLNEAESKASILEHSPSGKVPCLIADDGVTVWDSLAICETLAELHPEKHLWPADAAARRVARAVCAEMHSGFQGIRGDMPMNIRGSYPGKGRTPRAEKDIARVIEIWTGCRARFGKGGELLFGGFSIADAFYAPVVTRFRTYGVSLPAPAEAYAKAVEKLAAVREWCEAGRREKEFVAADEPYANN